MPISATIEFPQADADSLFRQMDRAQRLLGKHTVHALNSAAMFVGRSLAASTKTSPKERQILPISISKSKRAGVKSWGVTGWFGRPRSYQTKILNTSKGEDYVKERLGIIRRRGLAKKTMANMSRKMGALGASDMSHLSFGGQELARLASKHGTGERGGGEADPWVKMSNFLHYATDALKSGEADITTAIGRAARAMERSIDAQLRKKFGLA